MFTKEDILSRLRKGETAESIATDLADTLNAAEAEFQKEEEIRIAKAEEEAKRAEELKIKRYDTIQHLRTALGATAFYLHECVPGSEMLVDELGGLTDIEVMELHESLVDFIKTIGMLKTLEFRTLF